MSFWKLFDKCKEAGLINKNDSPALYKIFYDSEKEYLHYPDDMDEAKLVHVNNVYLKYNKNHAKTASALNVSEKHLYTLLSQYKSYEKSKKASPTFKLFSMQRRISEMGQHN